MSSKRSVSRTEIRGSDFFWYMYFSLKEKGIARFDIVQVLHYSNGFPVGERGSASFPSLWSIPSSLILNPGVLQRRSNEVASRNPTFPPFQPDVRCPPGRTAHSMRIWQYLPWRRIPVESRCRKRVFCLAKTNTEEMSTLSPAYSESSVSTGP